MGLVKNCLTPRYISARCMTLLKIIQIDRTISELDLCILVTHYWNSFKCKGHNSAKNYSYILTCLFSWHIYILNFNSKCQFVMEIMTGNWKLMEFFLSLRGITLPKIIRLDPNSNSTCVFSWHIFIPNFNLKCQFVMEIMSGNWKLTEFF